MNQKDLEIINLLQHNGKLSYSEIGIRVGLSISAVKDRIKKLTETQVLRSNVYLADPQKLGMDICAFVLIHLPMPTDEAHFVEQVQQYKEVQECHCITGEYSYLLKVRTKNIMALEQLLNKKINAIRGVHKTNTVISLTTPKEITQLDIL